MAGLKNIYQLYGGTPFHEIKGKDILERHEKRQATPIVVYCRFCGGSILEYSQDENGYKQNYQWEQAHQMHYKCYRKEGNF